MRIREGRSGTRARSNDMILLRHFALAAALAGLQQAPEQRGQVRNPVPFVGCTPDSIRLGTETIASKNPIADALKRAGPGTLIELAAGDYPAFSVGMSKQNEWNAPIAGGNRGQPIVVRAIGAARVVPGSSGDTIAIVQDVPCAHITFEGLTIIAGYRAGIMFYKCGPNQMHEGFRFLDCTIDGEFDHLTGRGRNSKWGVWGHSLKDFEFVGRKRPAVVRNIKNEHAFYLQNAKGDITLDNVQCSRVGRTFIQITARRGDGEPGLGTVSVRNCVIEDACLAMGDEYKGGSAFTVAGRHTGQLIFENNRYRAGFAPGIQKLTSRGAPYGTGAFVSWNAGGERNGTLILRNNDFEMAKGCGDRPLVSIGGCNEVQLGVNRFVAGAGIALDIDAPDSGNSRCERVIVDEGSTIQGPIRFEGATVDLQGLLARTQRAAPPAAPEKPQGDR